MPPRRLTVKLTPPQIAQATSVGRQRHAEQPGGNADLHVRNALAEIAVAIALDHAWSGEFKKLSEWKAWKRLKVSVNALHVRLATTVVSGLTLHETDPPDDPYVLVIDRDAPEYVLVGWMFGTEAKAPGYWDTSESLLPCFVVPQADLLSCTDLAREKPAALAPRSDYRRDPAPDFGGGGRWPQRRYADPGDHPSKHGNIIVSNFDLPCCRCQTMIPAGQPTGGDLVTGNIHGDPAQCKMSKKDRSNI